MATGGTCQPGRRDEEHDHRPGAGFVTAATRGRRARRARARDGSPASSSCRSSRFAAIMGGLIVGALIIILSSSLTGERRPAAAAGQAYANLLEGAFGSVRGHHLHDPRRHPAHPRRHGGRARLQGRALQHRRAGPVPRWAPWAPRRSAPAWRRAPPIIAVPVAVGAGALAGAAWGFIPGALKAWTGAHEVVTTIMLNFIASDLHRLPHHRPARGARLLVLPDRAGRQRRLSHRSSGRTSTSASSSPSASCRSSGGCCGGARSGSRSAPSAPTPTRRATPACAPRS